MTYYVFFNKKNYLVVNGQKPEGNRLVFTNKDVICGDPMNFADNSLKTKYSKVINYIITLRNWEYKITDNYKRTLIRWSFNG